MSGDAITIWSVRIALLLYVGASFSWLLGRDRWRRTTRALWSAALFLYLIHVFSAFRWTHAFSHERAALETARRTEELFGVPTSVGIWFNYLFTAVWSADVLWWWTNEGSYRVRPRWISVLTHTFLAFMFFNGAVVFARGFSRWVGLTAALPLLYLVLRGQRVSEVSEITTPRPGSTKKL